MNILLALIANENALAVLKIAAFVELIRNFS